VEPEVFKRESSPVKKKAETPKPKETAPTTKKNIFDDTGEEEEDFLKETKTGPLSPTSPTTSTKKDEPKKSVSKLFEELGDEEDDSDPMSPVTKKAPEPTKPKAGAKTLFDADDEEGGLFGTGQPVAAAAAAKAAATKAAEKKTEVKEKKS